MRIPVFFLFTALFLFVGCDSGHDHASDTPDDGHGAHGPHGGEILELGDGVAHIEVTHDEGAGTVLVYVLDGKMKPRSLAAAPVLNVPTDSRPLQVKGVSKSGGTEWEFRNEALKDHPEGARFRLELDGVPYTPGFPHEHH